MLAERRSVWQLNKGQTLENLLLTLESNVFDRNRSLDRMLLRLLQIAAQWLQHRIPHKARLLLQLCGFRRLHDYFLDFVVALDV